MRNFFNEDEEHMLMWIEGSVRLSKFNPAVIVDLDDWILLQAYYKQAEADKGTWEKAVDEFVQAEAERQYKMREAQWIREDQARINLLKDVYNSREQDILFRQAKTKEKDWIKNSEK